MEHTSLPGTERRAPCSVAQDTGVGTCQRPRPHGDKLEHKAQRSGFPPRHPAVHLCGGSRAGGPVLLLVRVLFACFLQTTRGHHGVTWVPQTCS